MTNAPSTTSSTYALLEPRSQQNNNNNNADADADADFLNATLSKFNKNGYTVTTVAYTPSDQVMATTHKKTLFEWKNSAENRAKKDVRVLGKNLPSGLPNGKATMNNSPKTRGSQGYKPGSKHPIGCSNTPQKGKTYDNGVTQCCLLSFSKNSLKQKGQKAATQSTHGYKGSQSNAGENRKMENFKINNNNKFNKTHGNAPNGECKKFCLRHE